MVDNISYLRSLKPKYNILIYLILISFSIIIASLFIFKIYDVNKVKGYVSCDNKVLVLEEIQPYGKKRMTVRDYVNGIDKNKLIGKVFK